MIAHIWGLLVPIGEYAYRTNLLSAMLSASAAGFFFLVVHESLRGWAGSLRTAAAAAGALIGAFTFTNWQNSNETEVYAVATFTIGAMCWAANLWRRQRETERRAPFPPAGGISRRDLHREPSAGPSRGPGGRGIRRGGAVERARSRSVPPPAGVGTARGRRRVSGPCSSAPAWGVRALTILGIGRLSGRGAVRGDGRRGALRRRELRDRRSGHHAVSLSLHSIGTASCHQRGGAGYLRRPARRHPARPVPAADSARRSHDPARPRQPRAHARPYRASAAQLLPVLRLAVGQRSRPVAPVRAVITVAFFSLGLQGLLAQRRNDRANWWLCSAAVPGDGAGARRPT